MGLLSKLFRKKDKIKENNKKINEIDSTELTQEELDQVTGNPSNSDWCPRVNVPTITIKSKQNSGKIGQNQNNLGR